MTVTRSPLHGITRLRRSCRPGKAVLVVSGAASTAQPTSLPDDWTKAQRATGPAAG
jgi:hypothetical protein